MKVPSLDLCLSPTLSSALEYGNAGHKTDSPSNDDGLACLAELVRAWVDGFVGIISPRLGWARKWGRHFQFEDTCQLR
jgi:hypothetical protein